MTTQLEWHRGPALGGEGTAGKRGWWDGDRLIIIVDTAKGREVAIVNVSADEGHATMRYDMEGSVCDWSVDSISWWAKLDKLPTSEG